MFYIAPIKLIKIHVGLTCFKIPRQAGNFGFVEGVAEKIGEMMHTLACPGVINRLNKQNHLPEVMFKRWI